MLRKGTSLIKVVIKTFFLEFKRFILVVNLCSLSFVIDGRPQEFVFYRIVNSCDYCYFRLDGLESKQFTPLHIFNQQ